MNTEELINNSNNIGSAPDMYHPDYGWLRIDGQLTDAGKDYFRDQMEQFEKSHAYVGNC